MANQHQLRMLRRGVRAWNLWREEFLGEYIDLEDADLRGVNLSGADLIGVHLEGADLSKANLCDTDLRGAVLRGANLYEANLKNAWLEEAILEGANCDKADLSEANFDKAELHGAHFNKAELREASLNNANLRMTNLAKANLSKAYLCRSDLWRADLRGANLVGANLEGADLSGANLNGANLYGAILDNARLVETDLSNATLNDCTIYGISAWGVKLDRADQKNLKLTPYGEPIITVDNLEVAQFIYMLLVNQKIRDVIDTITSKVVLILGRFTPERKIILDAIREELRNHNYLPILFDFEKPASRNLTETISTLAHMARFIIADITDPRSIPQEFQRIIPDLPSVPVQPLLHISTDEWGMFESFRDYDWVLDVYRYDNFDNIANTIESRIIIPVEAKAREIEERRREFEQKTLKGKR